MMHNKRTRIIRILALLAAALGFYCAEAQIIINEEPNRLYYDFTARRIKKFKDMRNFRDVFHVNKYLLGKNRIFGNLSYNTGRVLIANEREIKAEYRHALGIYTRFRFFEEFSVNSTFYVDFNKKAVARWTTDYSYAIGRYNWRPKKFNYGYENYINNKYTDDLKTFGQKFLEGYYFLSYSHLLPRKVSQLIRIDSTTHWKLLYFARYSIRYRDQFDNIYGSMWNGKATLGVASRFTMFWNIYIEGALYYYPEEAKRQPWDPDYSYGFGYFDWRSFRISITYGNWAINRFNAKDKAYPNYGFIDGQFRVIANWTW